MWSWILDPETFARCWLAPRRHHKQDCYKPFTIEQAVSDLYGNECLEGPYEVDIGTESASGWAERCAPGK